MLELTHAFWKECKSENDRIFYFSLQTHETNIYIHISKQNLLHRTLKISLIQIKTDL